MTMESNARNIWVKFYSYLAKKSINEAHTYDAMYTPIQRYTADNYSRTIMLVFQVVYFVICFFHYRNVFSK